MILSYMIIIMMSIFACLVGWCLCVRVSYWLILRNIIVQYMIRKLFFYNIFYGCGCFMVDNITILIVCISVIGVLSLFQGMETVLTTIVGGLIGFLAKDRVVNLETVNESDT